MNLPSPTKRLKGGVEEEMIAAIIQTPEEQAREIVDRSGEENLQQRELWREAIAAAIREAVSVEREQCARIAEAPFLGQPHTELSRGKMQAANTIARNIRART